MTIKMWVVFSNVSLTSFWVTHSTRWTTFYCFLLFFSCGVCKAQFCWTEYISDFLEDAFSMVVFILYVNKWLDGSRKYAYFPPCKNHPQIIIYRCDWLLKYWFYRMVFIYFFAETAICASEGIDMDKMSTVFGSIGQSLGNIQYDIKREVTFWCFLPCVFCVHFTT